MNHCPCCGAHIDPFVIKCAYCGSYYFDFAAFDCNTDKPVYVKFKTNQMGQPIVITALTKPSLECVETQSDSTDICDTSGIILHRFYTQKTCDITAKFRCIPGKNNTLFQVEVQDAD